MLKILSLILFLGNLGFSNTTSGNLHFTKNYEHILFVKFDDHYDLNDSYISFGKIKEKCVSLYCVVPDGFKNQLDYILSNNDNYGNAEVESLHSPFILYFFNDKGTVVREVYFNLLGRDAVSESSQNVITKRSLSDYGLVSVVQFYFYMKEESVFRNKLSESDYKHMNPEVEKLKHLSHKLKEVVFVKD